MCGICVFPSQVFSIKSLRMISDAQFECMGLAIGQIAMLKALLVAEDKLKRWTSQKVNQLIGKIANNLY